MVGNRAGHGNGNGYGPGLKTPASSIPGKKGQRHTAFESQFAAVFVALFSSLNLNKERNELTLDRY